MTHEQIKSAIDSLHAQALGQKLDKKTLAIVQGILILIEEINLLLEHK